jgi:CDP-4-dehydro-6-deoxyglucose reductase
MPDPKFMKPWHGVPREEIDWHPTIIEDACIGCGTCVTGCSRLVYRFDYDRKKSIVVDPLNCMVGCTTCANTCPTHAIRFPPMATVFTLEGRPKVRHAIEDELIARTAELAWPLSIPDSDKLVELRIDHIDRQTSDVLVVQMVPMVTGECFCEFVPGQYVEIWIPGSAYLSRAYSIANRPRNDGGIELHIHRVKGGRLSDWAFTQMKEGDRVLARGPLGHFTVRSAVDRPLLFIAGGTGFAPIKALIEQQLKLAPLREMQLFWGLRDLHDCYACDLLVAWAETHPNLHITLAAEQEPDPFPLLHGISLVTGNVAQALGQRKHPLAGHDAYVAGPPGMIPSVVEALRAADITPEHIFIDSFGLG